ncbi:rust resistance kinase Lr10-like isoform X2 [Carica papaya]|uniref:rust resistance kinase Lr10-like isoform X2 n=1 Tax=Carica papaya TaxID=3649 RepID=UPI000B8D182F|nr:rust resistance kinase Lr10-like isoform X2 [Carica papaya]
MFFYLFLLLLLLLLLHTEYSHGVDPYQCPESRCGADGPMVRFPFRLEKIQPQHCGYPGFHLSCTENNQTLLRLPVSVNLFVTQIDYQNQKIYIRDPHDCLPNQLQNLTLSASPFKFDANILHDFTIFSCSSTRGAIFNRWDRIECLSVPESEALTVPSFDHIDELSLTYCTKMYDLSSLPYSVFLTNTDHSLFWSKPSCGRCEAKGNMCRLKTGTSKPAIQCLSIHPQYKGSILGSLLLAVIIFGGYRFYTSDKAEKENQAKIKQFLEDFRALKPTRYSYADLKRITNQFMENLGEGAYGTVFKGKLSNEIFVAVKILNNSTGKGEEFINEVKTMGRIHHVNVVRLVGYCADGFRRALVYEYLTNNSLQKFISSADKNSNFLGWHKLQDIALGIAKGIEYLHQGCDQRILHFDIKPHNILLDENFNPKISDFGQAKLCSKDQSAVSMTAARGTMGYIAPEVFSRNFGKVSHKSDVYSFGMLLLEMVGGKKNMNIASDNTCQIYFPEWIYNLLEQGDELRIHMEGDEDSEIAKRLAIVGLWCIQWHPIDRPSMKVVVQMLDEGYDLTMPPNPFASTHLKGPTTSMVLRHRHRELKTISETHQELDIIHEME